MEIVYLFIRFCGLIGVLALIVYALTIVQVLFKVFRNLLNKEPVRPLLHELNFVARIKSFLRKTPAEELNEKENTLMLRKITVIMVFIGIAYQAVMISPFASERIGSIFEKPEYTTYYWVNMFPENSLTKNYQVKAKIHVFTDSDEDYSERRYEIEEAYFPDGGTITFCEYGYNESLKINERVNVRDDQKRDWGIVLLNIKGK
ncbi:MAG: hypothetical protein ABFD08_09660 [Syntrophomonas sp.]